MKESKHQPWLLTFTLKTCTLAWSDSFAFAAKMKEMKSPVSSERDAAVWDLMALSFYLSLNCVV